MKASILIVYQIGISAVAKGAETQEQVLTCKDEIQLPAKICFPPSSSHHSCE